MSETPAPLADTTAPNVPRPSREGAHRTEPPSSAQSNGGLEDRRRDRDKAVKEAQEMLSKAGVLKPAEVLGLAKRLANYKELGLARRLLKRVRTNPPLNRTTHADIFPVVYQKSALFTYKDPDLPLEWRLEQALTILAELEDLASTEDQETLGLAGAIYKRKWEVDGVRQNLERALFYYLRGYALGLREEHLAAAGNGSPRTPTTLAELRADAIGYLRAHPNCRLWAEKDRGYCGINAAFVLDLLAHEEDAEARRAGMPSTAARQRREDAQLIRQEIIRSVEPLVKTTGNEWLATEWWFHATLGEAYFGLGSVDPNNYQRAVECLVERPKQAGLKISHTVELPGKKEVPEWEYESTARQLARLARVQGVSARTEAEFEKTPAGRALAKILGNDRKALSSAYRGKYGLALSGGGFRASLFHIGVLAQLAELDLLRHVEVLSCVSGGSIVGAYYYLQLRKLLQSKPDSDIDREDYIRLVKELEQQFLAGVQRNIRTRILAELSTNLKMLFSPGYSRTVRLGELYERELYARIEDVEAEGPDGKPGWSGPVTGPRWLPDWLARWAGWRRQPRVLSELLIKPRGEDGTLDQQFAPRNHNWRRQNKAPILVLNAASLNTGHIWQFTASYMGEPPTPITTDIDSNYRLRRMYHRHAPQGHQGLRLGHAVAASSCVPGLFEPLTLDGLYPDDDGRLKAEHLITVGLVDGGVCDNQGVASLLEQDCSVLLISDASGQMDSQNVPSTSTLGVLLRSNSLLQARIREAQYQDVEARRRSSLLRGKMFVHLRQDLWGKNLAWKDCPSDLKESEFERQANQVNDATSFDVASDIQRKLSALRTDLDSWNDAEAFALMVSGYRMTAKQLEQSGIPHRIPTQRENWDFLAIERAMKPRSVEPDEAGRKRLGRILDVGASIAFKPWRLSFPLLVTAALLLALAAGAVIRLFANNWNDSVVPATLASGLTFRRVALFIAGMAALAVVGAAINAIVGKNLGKRIARAIRWQDTVRRIAIGVAMSVAGWLLARAHLHLFDRLYLRHGRRDRFPK